MFVFSCAFSGDCVAPRTAVLCLSLDIFSKDCNFTCASIPQRNRESITFRIYSDGRMLSVYVCVFLMVETPQEPNMLFFDG